MCVSCTSSGLTSEDIFEKWGQFGLSSLLQKTCWDLVLGLLLRPQYASNELGQRFVLICLEVLNGHAQRLLPGCIPLLFPNIQCLLCVDLTRWIVQIGITVHSFGQSLSLKLFMELRLVAHTKIIAWERFSHLCTPSIVIVRFLWKVTKTVGRKPSPEFSRVPGALRWFNKYFEAYWSL